MKYVLIGMAMTLLMACSAESKPSGTAPENMVNVQAVLPAFTGDHVWKVDTGTSQLIFVATHNGRKFEGVFGNFDAAIRLDPALPETGEIHAVIGMAAFDAGDNDRNANLPRPEWFDVKNHPTATYISQDIKALGGSNYEAVGDLTLKGVIHPLTLAFSLTAEGETATANGGVTFSRRLFDVGSGSDFENEDWVSFPVDVKFEIVATRASARRGL